MEEMASNSALECSGWLGVQEGTGSKCGEVVEWTGGEPKGAEQPLLQSSHWTLEQEASNVGRWSRRRPMLDAAYASVQRAQLAKVSNGLGLGPRKGLKNWQKGLG